MPELSAEEIRDVWGGNVQPVSGELIPAGVPSTTTQLLTTVGLPTVPLLGFTFFRDHRMAVTQHDGRAYLVFGIDSAGSALAVDLESEHVCRVDPEPGGEVAFYNSTLALFVYFHGLLQRNVLSLTEVDEQLLADAVDSVWRPLEEQDPPAVADRAPWHWVLADLETQWQ
ncbi:SUKH-4 family immunity protein [Nocardia thraciensis]